ncbi:hypothetical protein [Candidatus Palauibacter soopunensis]|uniref:hypothetical protein n=1 Tax=Candidatus Palauibacter soopunensis TaxID=3056739 RepID=UPI0023A75C85|nr:hypothetical protein [Candidatus Palauibacter soopunensis]MDE2877648.1 hypothetical protein [Candidatus Palauibacter soopunensis]
MSRIHFVVKKSARLRYQAQADREGKSLAQWLREAADEKLEAARPRLFTVEELKAFAAKCDAMHPPGAREPSWGGNQADARRDSVPGSRRMIFVDANVLIYLSEIRQSA